MFGDNTSRRSKVDSFNVKNFETEMKTVPLKQQKFKIKRFRSQKISLKDIKMEGKSEACKKCKRKGLELTSGECKECEKEFSRFEGEEERRRKEAFDKLSSINSQSDFRTVFGWGDVFDRNYDALTYNEKRAVREKFIDVYETNRIHVGTRVRTWPRWAEEDDFVYEFGYVAKVEDGRDQIKKFMKVPRSNNDNSVLFVTSRALNDVDQRRRRVRVDQGKAAVYYKRGRKYHSDEKKELNRFLIEIEKHKPFLGMKSELEKYVQEKPYGYFRNHIRTNGKQWAFVGTFSSEERLLKAKERAKKRVRAKIGRNPELKLIKTKFSYKDPFSSNYPGKNGKYALYIVERGPTGGENI